MTVLRRSSDPTGETFGRRQTARIRSLAAAQETGTFYSAHRESSDKRLRLSVRDFLAINATSRTNIPRMPLRIWNLFGIITDTMDGAKSNAFLRGYCEDRRVELIFRRWLGTPAPGVFLGRVFYDANVIS